jgi:hypothetical protein
MLEAFRAGRRDPMRGRCLLPLPVLVIACGCGHAVGAATGALVNLAIGATASGVSRATGGCYANCPPGTSCNPATGFCETLPCRGQCGPEERCVQVGRIERCESTRADATLQLLQPIRGGAARDAPRTDSSP